MFINLHYKYRKVELKFKSKTKSMPSTYNDYNYNLDPNWCSHPPPRPINNISQLKYKKYQEQNICK